MKPTSLLLSVIATALLSQTHAKASVPWWTPLDDTFSPIDPVTWYRGVHLRCGSFSCKSKLKYCANGFAPSVPFRPESADDCERWKFACITVCAGRDETDEDECSTRNFDRVLVATAESTGRVPNTACARAVFDQICDQCEDNLQCYLKLGRQVGPETPQCQPRRLRRLKYWNAERNACYKQCEHTADPNDWGRAYCVTECMGETWRL